MVEIDIGSNLITFGSFILSWHGFFSFIAVATAVYLVGRWAPLVGVDPDAIYSIAIWRLMPLSSEAFFSASGFTLPAMGSLSSIAAMPPMFSICSS